jgi:uncharacterized membrane protein
VRSDDGKTARAFAGLPQFCRIHDRRRSDDRRPGVEWRLPPHETRTFVEELMESKVKLFGHPVHQMLVVFPLGLLATSVVFDLIHLGTGSPFAASVASVLIVAGLIGGALAAPFGAIDWLNIPPQTRAKAIGAMHGGGNVVVLLVFAFSLWLRHERATDPPALACWLSFAGAALVLVTAWLGGELVDRLGVGVSPHAHLNARSSLEGPAEAIGDREAAAGAR